MGSAVPFLLSLIYVPGALLMATWLAFGTGILSSDLSPLVLRNLLDSLNVFHFGLFLVWSAGILTHTYWTVREPELRQQMNG